MPGGLMQLVAYGSEDLYLTGNPQFTYWRLVYKRYSNYSSEYVPQYFTISPTFSPVLKTQMTCKIERVGDLLHDCYFVIDLPTIYGDVRSCFRWHDYLGYNIIEWAKLLIGGQQIDQQYSEWMLIWNELTLSSDKKKSFDQMIGNSSNFKIYNRTTYTDFSNPVPVPATYGDGTILYRKNRLYVPLMFWFCRNPGLALPLIALQYEDVFIQLEVNQINDWFKIGSAGLSPAAFFAVDKNATDVNVFYNGDDFDFRNKMDENGIGPNNIWYYFTNTTLSTDQNAWPQNCYIDCNYIYLDEDERREFAVKTHEYLITQIQYRRYDGLSPGVNRLKIELLHSVKELFWVFNKQSLARVANEKFNYTMFNKPEVYDYFNNAVQNNINSINLNTNGLYNGLSSNININNFMINSFFVNRISGLIDEINPSIVSNRDNLSDNFYNIFQGGKFLFNGTDRQAYKDEKYWSNLQYYKYHTNAPRIPGIYVWSYSLFPERDQPSGTANFSRINKVEFEFNLKDHVSIDDVETYNGLFSIYNSLNTDSFTNLETGLPAPSFEIDNNIRDYEMRLYALNYNILRLVGGTGGVAFAN